MKDTDFAPTKVVQDYLNFSAVWHDFIENGGFIDGDIVIAGPLTGGCTWVECIVKQILGAVWADDAARPGVAPWLDSSWGNHASMLRLLADQRANGQRRIIKSHLPADALPISSDARYIFIGRNGKDVGIGLHKYLSKFSAAAIGELSRRYSTSSGHPTPLLIPHYVQQFFGLWLDSGGYGCCDVFGITDSWWKVAHADNVLLIHHQNLRKDLPGQILRIANFLSVGAELFDIHDVAAKCLEQYPPSGVRTAAQLFREQLTPQLIERFDRLAMQKLHKSCARWLESGADE